MSIRTAEVHKFYVNEEGKGLVRQVLVIEGSNLFWRDFDVRDGTPYGTNWCSVGHFKQWATRGAAPVEISRLQVDKSNERLLAEQERRQHLALSSVSNEELLEEVRHRDLLEDFSADELLAEIRRRGSDRDFAANQSNHTPKWSSFLPQNHINPWFDPFQFFRMGIALERFRILYQRGYFDDFPDEARDFVAVVNESFEILEDIDLGELARYPVIPSDVFSAIGYVMEFLYELDEEEAAISPVSDELRPEYLRPDKFDEALESYCPTTLVVSPEEYRDITGDDPEPASE